MPFIQFGLQEVRHTRVRTETIFRPARLHEHNAKHASPVMFFCIFTCDAAALTKRRCAAHPRGLGTRRRIRFGAADSFVSGVGALPLDVLVGTAARRCGGRAGRLQWGTCCN